MSSNLTEQTRIRMIIEDQIRRLDAIYKITCSSKDYLGWKKQGLSEKELLLLEQRLGKNIPDAQRIALNLFEFRISPQYALDIGFSDGDVPINNMNLAADFIVGDSNIGNEMQYVYNLLPNMPKYSGALHHVVWHKGLMMIGAEDTFYWFVDLNPPENGVYGQIICAGFEEIKVVANNYMEFLEIIIKSFPKNDFS